MTVVELRDELNQLINEGKSEYFVYRSDLEYGIEEVDFVFVNDDEKHIQIN